MAAVAQAGKEAGTLFIPALNRTIKLVEWREDDFYDTITTATDTTAVAAAVSAGASFEFFRDLANKNLQHTNLRTARRIPAGSEFIMSRIGVVLNQAFGNVLALASDILKVAYAATLSFKINDRLVSEGPLFKFQSGYGVSGTSTETAISALTLGVASAAAAPTLMVAQPVQDDDDLQGTVDFKSISWSTNAAMPTVKGLGVTLMLHGYIKKPQGK
jgi:hypothetical protein